MMKRTQVKKDLQAPGQTQTSTVTNELQREGGPCGHLSGVCADVQKVHTFVALYHCFLVSCLDIIQKGATVIIMFH